MQFSLKNTKGTSTTMPRLKGNEIHTVVFKGVTYNTFKGKKDESAVYQVMKIRFENKDGYYEETVFAPKENDDKRITNTFNGVERESPSNLEKLIFLMAHIGEQLAPKEYEKFKEQSFDLPADFKKMVELFAKVVQPFVGKTTKLKLINNKKGESQLPFFVNLNKAGEAYISNNFLGENVFFTDYEVKQMKAKETKPSNMDAITADGESEAGDIASDVDLDFEV